MKTIEVGFPHRVNKQTYSTFRCHCGKLFVSQRSNVLCGGTKGCGCLRGKDKTHGQYIGDKASLTMITWRAMLARCYNKTHKNYSRYGGKGIKVLFNSIEELMEEIGLRPSKEYTLDRINNEGHYEPGNVRWATAKEQALNRRNSRT